MYHVENETRINSFSKILRMILDVNQLARPISTSQFRLICSGGG
jgi:hypothetical protein